MRQLQTGNVGKLADGELKAGDRLVEQVQQVSH
jgi:hypothetical protein